MIFNKYEEAVDYIHALPRLGSQLSLDRIKKLLDLIDNPQNQLKFIHIAGTNGKGTLTTMCEVALKSARYRVGAFTSPFINDFRERFRINKEMISRPALLSIANLLVNYVNALAAENIFVTEFEFITALAFEFFKRKKCDIVCLEVGIGGKFDATNVITAPEVAVITAISYDHVDLLGDTLTKIAGEKVGIIKENTTVVTVPCQEKEVLDVIIKKCNDTSSELIITDEKTAVLKSVDCEGSSFTIGELNFKINLIGKQQYYNALTLFNVMNALNTKGFNVKLYDMRVGIANIKLPARFEKISSCPTIYLDGGHNLQAAQNLSQTLELVKCSKKVALIGMMADKDCEGYIKTIAPSCDAIVTVPIESNVRSIPPQELAEIAKKHHNNVFSCETMIAGIQQMVALLGEKDVAIVCGSFYLASDVRRIIRNKTKQY